MIDELIKKIENYETVDEEHEDILLKDLISIYIEHITLYKEYNSILCYKYAYNKFASLHMLKVKDIKKLHVQHCVDGFIKEELKPRTILSYINKLKLLLDYYKENYNSVYFIFNNIKLPEEKNETTKKALSKNEFDNLLKLLEGNKYYLIALVAGTCGLRCGEILGLTWDDVDTKNCSLNINKQWKVDKKSKQSDFGNLKGQNSYRVVPIPPNTLESLEQYKNNCADNANKRIFPYSNSSIKRFLNPLLNEISGITIHELRHTYATLLIANNIDFKTTADFLGHDVQQTIKTYSHVTDEMKKKATDTISKIFC